MSNPSAKVASPLSKSHDFDEVLEPQPCNLEGAWSTSGIFTDVVSDRGTSPGRSIHRISNYLLAVLTCLLVVAPSAVAQEAVSCFVFDDGYTNLAGPSDAIYIAGSQGAKACIPDGTTNGTCRKWFGRCRTNTTLQPVIFYVFDDQRGSTQRGPSDAIYFPSGGKQACIPDATSTGTCRRWVGEGFSGVDGNAVVGTVFDDGYTNQSTPSDAIYIPQPQNSPGVGKACIPDSTSTGTCRKWFGRFMKATGTPVTYTEVITGPTGWPSGTLGGISFPPPGDSTILTLTFSGNTANVVPFFAPRGCQPNCPQDGINDGEGFFHLATGNEVATVKVQAASTGALLAQGTFGPSAGIFVSVDQGNSGIGFGSQGALPGSSGFPGEPVYPYALFTSPKTTDLKSPYNITGQPANSIIGFAGAPFFASLPLETSAGQLIINNDSQVVPQPTGSFSVETIGYTLSVTPLTPSTVLPGASAKSTITLNPWGGYSGTVTLSCTASSAGIPQPSCSPSVSSNSPVSTLTVTTNSTTRGTYSIAVNGADSAGQTPSNGVQFVSVAVEDVVQGGTGGGGTIALSIFAALLGLWSLGCRQRRKREPR
jgi:hypothetical protein